MKTIWIVFKERETDDNDDVTIVCGVYDNFGDAIARVGEVFDEEEDKYIDEYGVEATCRNHNNGFAECTIDYGLRTTTIKAVEFKINKDIYELI